jgi:hypothetical protein
VTDSALTDPLGRSIVLHDRRWHGHIIKRHPEIESYMPLLRRAITEPIEIRYSQADVDCRVYFGEGPRKGIMIAIVVDLAGGFVKTAHLIKAAKGVVEWSRQTP